MPSSASDHRLHAAARAAFPHFQLEVVARTGSTQDRVRQAARAGADAGFCCIAQEQTAGRGRQDRRWTAPAGTALLASILLAAPRGAVTLTPLAAGVAVCDVLAAACGLTTAALKWPNDVLVQGRKLAGILAEVEPRSTGSATVVLGIGVNLTVPEFDPSIAGVSLHALVDEVPSPEDLLLLLLPPLAHRLEQAQARPDDLLASWRGRATGLGAAVTVIAGNGRLHGVAADVDSDGALLVETATGRVRVLAGDVHLESAARA